MLRRHIVLMIAIHLLDGDVKPGGPLGAMRRHRVSTSPLLSSSSQTVTHTVTLTSTFYSRVHYTDTRPTRNVV